MLYYIIIFTTLLTLSRLRIFFNLSILFDSMVAKTSSFEAFCPMSKFKANFGILNDKTDSLFAVGVFFTTMACRI